MDNCKGKLVFNDPFVVDVDNCSTVSQNTEEQPPDKETEDVDPPQIPKDPNARAICQYCGYTSVNKLKCESCHRKFTSATRYTVQPVKTEPDAKRRKVDGVIVTEPGGVNKKTFYSSKVKEQNQIYVQVFESLNAKTIQTIRSIAPKRGRGRGRGRGVIIHEPVMISSDEEDGGGDGINKVRQLSAPSTPSSGRSPSHPEHGTPESPLIPNIPISKTDHGRGRVGKMENKKGAVRADREKSVSPVELMLTAKFVRVGSFRGAAIEPILVSKTGLSFFIEGSSGSHKFSILAQEIQQCLARFTPESSLIFILTSEHCGIRTRKDLGIPLWMNHALPPPEPYFDPVGTVLYHQMITITMDPVEAETKAEFIKYMDYFKSWGKQGDEMFYMELTESEAEDVLRSSTHNDIPQTRVIIQPLVNADGQMYANEEAARSPSPPRIGFAGPVIKLLTYPPPPEKGGISITNEDLYCLQEGEFLNDVIIDFYLNYLLLEKLSPEDRARTHIFSSFFYKRLTQRIRGAALDDDPNLSLPEKRHARVKNWTRRVDLFKKDFIVIPINEHAHWFLAIVCFPGLEEPEQNMYIPNPPPESPADIPNVPTPPQPTDDNTEEMETDENQQPDTQNAQPDTTQVAEGDNTVSSSDNVQNGPNSEETGGQKNTVDQSAEKEQQQGETENTKTQSEAKAEGTEETQATNEAKGVENEEKKEANTEGNEASRKEDANEGNKADDQKEAENTSDETKESNGAEKELQSSSDDAGNTAEAGSDSGKTSEEKTSKPSGKVIRGKPAKGDENPSELAYGIKQPTIIVFDSLIGPSRSRIVQVLKEYFMVEWQMKKGGTELNKSLFKGCSPKVPQQNNYSDCGVFMLQYVESFFEDPIQDFSTPMKGLEDWFSVPKINGKREEIRDLIIDLKEKIESKGDKKEAS